VLNHAALIWVPTEAVAEALPEADVVIVLAPVTTEAAGMVDAAFLVQMKDGARLVNAARGALIVIEDLWPRSALAG
jgi:phosphoglycerate dehydrogenase-like enzyme